MLGERASMKFGINDAMEVTGIDQVTVDVYIEDNVNAFGGKCGTQAYIETDMPRD